MLPTVLALTSLANPLNTYARNAAPVDRVQRRIVDRLVSLISPVCRLSLPHEGLEL